MNLFPAQARNLSLFCKSPAVFRRNFHSSPLLFSQIIPLESPPQALQPQKKWLFKEDKHTNLETLLSHGYEESNYFTGTKFEYETLNALARYNFMLERVGKAYDEGVDFKGTWSLPDKMLSVIGQCKKYGKPLGTNVLKEFDGTLARLLPEAANKVSNATTTTTIGLLVSGSGFSLAASRFFMAGKFPVIVCTLDQEDITYFCPNALAQKLLPNLIVGSKYISKSNSPTHKKVASLSYHVP